jgi:hypothetical protein
MRKKIIPATLLMIFSLNTFSQAPPIQWQKCFGGTSSDGALSIQQTSDGGYMVT